MCNNTVTLQARMLLLHRQARAYRALARLWAAYAATAIGSGLCMPPSKANARCARIARAVGFWQHLATRYTAMLQASMV